jgi:hypothetical protein
MEAAINLGEDKWENAEWTECCKTFSLLLASPELRKLH